MTTLRRATEADASFLQEMLVAAVDWRPEVEQRAIAAAMSESSLAHYVDGWMRPGDFGMLAEQGGVPVGAAWWRFFSADDPGYGFVNPQTPEVTVGVRQHARRQGIGQRLMRALVANASTEGVDAVSLSVEPGNHPARRLYERLGFQVVGSCRGSLTMLLHVRPA